MKSQKLLILDLDNTLYDYDKCHDLGLSMLFQFLSEKINLNESRLFEEYRMARNQVKKRLRGSASAHNRILYIQQIFVNLNLINYSATLNEAVYIYWDNYFKNMKLYDRVEEFLLLAKSLSFQIIVVTDLLSEIQNLKIKKLGIEKFVDHVFSSEFLGIEKPDYRSFDQLKKFTGIPKSGSVCIGDSDFDHLFKRKTLFFKKSNSTTYNMQGDLVEFNDFGTLISEFKRINNVAQI